MIVLTDFFALFVLFSLIVLSYLKAIENKSIDNSEYLLFQVFTEGIIIILFAFKCYYGAKFLKISCCPDRGKIRKRRTLRPNETEEQEYQRNQMRIVKNQRRELNKFFIFSVVTYCFTIIQNISLIFPYWL